MKPNPAPSLALLSAITALAFCALHMVVPALPLLVQVFDDSPAHVQLVLSLYLGGHCRRAADLWAGVGPLRPPAGADRRARRCFSPARCCAASAWSLAGADRRAVAAGARRLRRHRAGARDHPRRLRPRGGGARPGARHDGDDAGAGDLAGSRRLPRRMVRLARDFRPARRARRGRVRRDRHTARRDQPAPGAARPCRHGAPYALAAALAGLCRICAVQRLHQRVVVYLYRQRALSRHRRAGRAAQHLRADDPLPDGDLHARQCCGGAVRATGRQLAAADRRPRPGVGRRRRG